MSEMLGNQYFLARRYKDALLIFKKILASGSDNILVKKKLIICLIESNMIDEALKLFSDIINEDVCLITDTDPVRDDCPCIQLIFDFENSITKIKDELNRNAVLGMLWLYCDLERSVYYFKKAVQSNPKSKLIQSIYTVLNTTTYKFN